MFGLHYADRGGARPSRSEAIGAVIARTDLGRIVALLISRADIALLMSPQGVVQPGGIRAHGCSSGAFCIPAPFGTALGD